MQAACICHILLIDLIISKILSSVENSYSFLRNFKMMIDNIYWPEVLNETWNHYDEWAGDDFQRRMAVVNYIPSKLNLAMILLFTFLDVIRIVIITQGVGRKLSQLITRVCNE